MAHKKPSRANERFYAKQAAEFIRLDRDCVSKHMTRAEYKRTEGLRQHNGIKEERSAYGLHRGQRGVLLDHPAWKQKCWVIFLD